MSDDYKLVKYDIRTPGGALAYTRGQVIAAAAVEANGWQESVVGRDTQEARGILADITGDEPAEEPKATKASSKANASETGQPS